MATIFASADTQMLGWGLGNGRREADKQAASAGRAANKPTDAAKLSR